MKRILLALLLLPVAAHSQSMRVDSTVHRVMYRLGLTTSGDDLTTQAKIKATFGGALREVCKDFPAIEATATTVVCPDSLLSGSYVNSRVVSIHHVKKIVNGVSFDLIWLPFEKFREVLAAASPDKFRAEPSDTLLPPYWSSFGNRVWVSPSVVKGCSDPDTLLVMYRSYEAPITSDASVLTIEGAYLEALELKLLELASQHRLDYQTSAWWRQQYDAQKPPVDRAAELKK